MSFMDRLAAENHASHRLARRWHWAHAGAYVLLIALYTGAACWHVAAAKRHARST